MKMITRIMCGLLLFLASAIGGHAQRFSAFIGFSYSGYGPSLPQLPVAPQRINHSLNGWNGSLGAKVLPFLGIIADFSGHYGNETTTFVCIPSPFVPVSSFCSPDSANVSFYTFTAGPQVSLPLGRIEPYAHALFGGAHYRESGVPFPRSGGSFADVLGGGIDFKLIPWLGWRVQADAIQTRFFFATRLPNEQNSLRLSTGLVVHF